MGRLGSGIPNISNTRKILLKTIKLNKLTCITMYYNSHYRKNWWWITKRNWSSIHQWATVKTNRKQEGGEKRSRQDNEQEQLLAAKHHGRITPVMDRGQCESGSWRQLIMMSKSEQCGGLFWHILTFARPRAALGWAAAPPPYSLARSRTFSLVLLLPPLNTGLLLSDPASSLSPTGRPAVYNLSTTIRYGQHSWCCRTRGLPATASNLDRFLCRA